MPLSCVGVRSNVGGIGGGGGVGGTIRWVVAALPPVVANVHVSKATLILGADVVFDVIIAVFCVAIAIAIAFAFAVVVVAVPSSIEVA
jgi:hypothetical protein